MSPTPRTRLYERTDTDVTCGDLSAGTQTVAGVNLSNTDHYTLTMLTGNRGRLVV